MGNSLPNLGRWLPRPGLAKFLKEFVEKVTTLRRESGIRDLWESVTSSIGELKHAKTEPESKNTAIPEGNRKESKG